MFSLYGLFAFALIVFLLFALLLLFIPLDLALALQLDEKVFRGRFTLKWLFFSYCFSSEDGKGKAKWLGGNWVEDKWVRSKFKKARAKFKSRNAIKKQKERAAKEETIKERIAKERAAKKGGEIKEGVEKADKKAGRNFSFYLEAFRALSRPFFRLCTNILGAAKVREFDFFLAFGFDDPADTGLCCGFLHGLRGVLAARCTGARLVFSPNFLDRELEIKGRTAVRVRLYMLGFSFLKFLFDPRTFGFAFRIFSNRIKKFRPKV